MANPCFCGCSLKTASLIIAIINMILAAISFFMILIWIGILIGAAVPAATKVENGVFVGATLGALISILIVVLIVCIFEFYLALTLKHGADQEDLRKCRIWLIFSAVLFVIEIIFKMVLIIIRGAGPIEYVIFSINIVYCAFSMWVVYEFMTALKSGQVFDTPAASARGTGQV